MGFSLPICPTLYLIESNSDSDVDNNASLQRALCSHVFSIEPAYVDTADFKFCVLNYRAAISAYKKCQRWPQARGILAEGDTNQQIEKLARQHPDRTFTLPLEDFSVGRFNGLLHFLGEDVNCHYVDMIRDNAGEDFARIGGSRVDVIWCAGVDP